MTPALCGAQSPEDPTLALDPGFEQAPVGDGPEGFRYAPSESPWQFDGAGVSANGSRFTAANRS